jgi:hypothetical protein
MKKKLSKRADGKRLNEEGRLSPLEVFQTRLEYYHALAQQEIALGDLADGEKVDQYLRLGQEAGEALAPYRHPRLQATAVTHHAASDLEQLLSEIEALDQGPLPARQVSMTRIDPDKTRH